MSIESNNIKSLEIENEDFRNSVGTMDETGKRKWIFPRKLPGEQESQGKTPNQDDTPTNQKTFWVYRTHAKRSLHEGVIRRLKYAHEPAP